MSSTPRPSAPKQSIEERHAFSTGFDQGHTQGKREGQDSLRKLILDFLEARYMSPQIERGTPQGDAILEVTADLARMLKEHQI